MRLPYYGTKEDVPLASGWSALRVDQLYEQLPIGFRRDLRSCSDEGEVPVVDQSASGYLGFHSDEPGVLASPSSPVVTFANHTCAMRVHRRPFSVIQNVFPKIGKAGVCDTLYLYYCTNGRVKTSEYKGHHPEWRAGYVPVPPIPVQRRIVSILSVYDDLIENNARRIQILEESAQSLYREWFVEYRFPGGGAAGVGTSPGQMPEAWEEAKLSDYVVFEKGVEPGSRSYLSAPGEGLVPFLRVGDFGKRGSSTFVPEAVAKGKFLTPGDVAITMDGTVGVVRNDVAGAFSSAIRKVVVDDSHRIGKSYLFLCLQSDAVQRVIEAHATGTTIKHASSCIPHLRIPLPPEPVMRRFEELVSPLLDMKANLTRSIRALRSTSDLLLPRLVSGDLDAHDLDKDTLGVP